MVTRGSYCLCIQVKENSRINIGALGCISFPKGIYIYIGSALNSLIPRLKRHLKTNNGASKVTHWHIDYLLKHPAVEILNMYSIDWAVRIECDIAAKVSERGTPIENFGCSDCGCVSHLYKVDDCRFLKEIGLKERSSTELVTD